MERKKIIMKNRDFLDLCANALLEKEKLYQDEFEALWNLQGNKAVDENE